MCQMKTCPLVCSFAWFVLCGPSGASLVYSRWLLLMTEEAGRDISLQDCCLIPETLWTYPFWILCYLVHMPHVSFLHRAQEGRRGKETAVFSGLLEVHLTCPATVINDKALRWAWQTGAPHATTPELLFHRKGRKKGSTPRLAKDWKMLAWSADILKVENNFPKWPIFQRVSHYKHLLFHCLCRGKKDDRLINGRKIKK